MKWNKYFLLGIAINIFLCILPVYTTSNVYAWTQLGLSFTRSAPVFIYNINPQQFFTLMVFIPMEMVYEHTVNIYITALTLKAIILLFNFLLILIVNKILNQLNLESKAKDLILYVMLFNPMILFVNYIWAEIEIIPVFFVTLSWYILRFRSLNIKNIFISMLSLLISIFFFLYPLVLVPTFIIYTKGKINKIFMFLVGAAVGILFILLDIHFFTGHFYNYVSSLSGTNPVLAPSGLQTGLFYYFHIMGNSRVITEIILFVIVSIFLPIILKLNNLPEYRVIYIILALIIFISPVINMDNFMFVLPFAFLSAINIKSGSVSKRILRATVYLTLIPVIFAQFIYAQNGVFGFFYWFYPLLHMDGISFSWQEINKVFIPDYNLFFFLIVFYSIFLLLNEVNSKTDFGTHLDLYHNAGKAIRKVYTKKKSLTIVIIIIIIVISAAIPISVIYNNYNNRVQFSHPTQFPLLYFYPEQFPVNSIIYLPIGKNSYTINGSTLYIPSSDTSLLLYRNISNQYFYGNFSITVNNSSGIGPLVYTNTWSIQKQLLYNNSLLHIYEPTNAQYTNKTIMSIPFINRNITTYFLNGSQTINYNIPFGEIQNKDFVIFFKSIRISQIQSLPVYLRIGNDVLEIAQYPTYEVIAKFIPNEGWVQTSPIAYNVNASQWQVATISYEKGTMYLSVNGADLGISTPASFSNIDLIIGNPFGNINYSFVGYTSSIFSYSKSVNPSNSYIAFTNGSRTYMIEPLQEKNYLTISFNNSQRNSSIIVNNKSFSVEYSKYLYFQKTGSGSESIKVTQLDIIYNGKGQYMIPAFLASYYPFAFALVTTYFIILPETREEKRK